MVKYSASPLEKPRREIEHLLCMGYFISEKGAIQKNSCTIVMFLWLWLVIFSHFQYFFSFGLVANHSLNHRNICFETEVLQRIG